MGIVKQQGFKNSIFFYLGTILGYLNVGFLFPKFFTADQFGLTRVFLALSSTIAMISQFGIPNVIIKYFPYFKNTKKGHYGFLFLAIFFPTILMLLAFLILIFFKDLIIAIYDDESLIFGKFFLLILPLIIAQLYHEILSFYCKSIYRSNTPIFLKEVVIRLFVLLIILLYSQNFIDFHNFMVGFVGAYFISLLFLLGYLLILDEFHFKPNFQIIKEPLFKEISKFSIYVFGNKASLTLTHKIDILMVGALLNIGLAGIYGLAFIFGTLVSLPARSINPILSPMVAESFKNNDYNKLDLIYKKSSLNNFILGSLIFTLIWSNSERLLLFINQEYLQGIYVIFFIGLARLTGIGSGLNKNILITSKYFRYELVFNMLFLMLTIISNFIFIKLWGITGAAFATALSLFLNDMTRIIFVYKKLNLHPFTKNLLFALVIFLIFLTGGSFLPDHQNVFISIGYKSVLISVLFFLIIFAFKISEDINETVIKVWKRFFSK